MRQFVALVPLSQRCDNGAAVHQVDNGAAADRLAGVRSLDAGGAASSCPHDGQLPRTRENLDKSQHLIVSKIGQFLSRAIVS